MSTRALPSLKDARLLRLGDVAKTAGGSTPSRGRKDYWSVKAGVGVPWVRTAEIAFEPIVKTAESLSETAMSECSLPIGPAGTVLIAMFGEGKTRGQSAVLEISATFNQACFAIFPNDAFEPKYLQLWLQSKYQDLRKLADGRGGSQANLNGSILEDLQVPWVKWKVQQEIVRGLDERLETLKIAAKASASQGRELHCLANAVLNSTMDCGAVRTLPLGDVLDEVKTGVGSVWEKYPVLGATRSGLAPARELPGKSPERYKPVLAGTIFYNPMRILIGSIAFVDDDDEPGITSPDYVVLNGKPGVVDSRWFYYWLRSPMGERCIQSLARGAVRERMLFNRLADGEIELPCYDTQETASKALAQIKPMRTAIEKQMGELELMSTKVLAQVFEN